MGRFRRGDLILNKWAGERNPTRVSMFVGSNGKTVTVIDVVRGTLGKGVYYSRDLMNDTEHFIKIGHSDAFEVMKRDILAALKETEDKESGGAENG